MIKQVNNLMLTVLSLSLAGSIIIAILFLCKPLYKKRLSKKWQDYIWLIVIARLLVPFSFEVNFVGSLFNEIGQANVSGFLGNEQSDVVISGDGAIIIGPSDEAHTANLDLQNHLPLSEMQTPVPYSQSDIISVLMSYIWLVWIVVAAILFIRKVTIYQSFAGYIRAGRVPLEHMADLERFGKLVEQAKIKRMVGIYTNSLVSSPLLIGFFKPYIVLPTTDISEADFRHTIMHELTHYKRGDMFYKWLVQLTICLHWFNPLVYLMGREINNACEFSCDEAVIMNLNNDGIKEYGNTLLNALGFGGEYKNSLSSVTLSENKKILEERLSMIKNFKKKSAFAAFCALLLSAGLVMGASIIGAYGFASPQVNQANQANQEVQANESQDNAQLSDFIVPTLSVHELHSRIERPDGTITPEAAAEIVARYIWDNFGVNIDGSVVFMNYQYTQARMRTHADDEDVMVGAWSFRVGDETMAAINMISDFMGTLNATTGEMIAIFPANSENQITALVPFSGSSTRPNPYFEGRQVQFVELQIMTNHDDVLAFSYNPQTRVMWITNTRERVDVPPNHVNIRCAETGEIFHVQIVGTNNDIPVVAFVVKITENGSPRLLALDNNGRPLDDGNIVIGLSPLDVSPPAPPGRPGYNVVQHNGLLTAYAQFCTGQSLGLLFNENRQILLTKLQNMENSDDVFEFSYNPQTNVMWIVNTGERADVPPNHVNVRCADTGVIFHIQIIDTVDGVPQLAFFAEIADDGSPRLISIDNTTRPNIIADGNITIGLSPSQP